MRQIISNWGNNLHMNANIYIPENENELKKIIKNNNGLLARGNGKSYGDVAINKNIISLKKFNKIINFDKKKGVIDVESGVLLNDVLPIIFKYKYFFPVTPGTKFVTIGGIIASNVHGKNCKKNSLKFYIQSLRFVNYKGKIIECSKKKNSNFYNLLVGGLGLNGIIISAKIKLIKIKFPYLKKKNLYFRNIIEFKKNIKLSLKHDYSFCWIDTYSNYNNLKGIFFCADHIKNKIYKNNFIYPIKKKKINFLHKIIFWAIKRYSFYKVFNIIFFIKEKYLNYKKLISFENFFYKQDVYLDWNKVYGRKGFFEFHILVDNKNFDNFINYFFKIINSKKFFSTLIVLKKFNFELDNLNFQRKGYSFSFDFPIDSRFKELRGLLLNSLSMFNLKVNFSKDLIYKKNELSHLKMIKKFKIANKLLNPRFKFQSMLSKRIGLT